MNYMESIANKLYIEGKKRGIHKITDKTQWRECVMADNLGHKVHEKISAGANADEYGSDALNEESGRYAEYKSNAIVESQLRNYYQLEKGVGKTFAPLVVKGVYNGAYKDSAIDAYSKIDHFFGVFFEERNMLIIQVDTNEVIRQLTENNAKRKPGATTNCNNVSISLRDTHLYQVAYECGISYNELVELHELV